MCSFLMVRRIFRITDLRGTQDYLVYQPSFNLKDEETEIYM